MLEVVKVFEGQNSESLKSRKKAKHPPLIHCSAGVGRTGVFIAFLQVKYILKRDVLPTNFSVRNCVRKLRQQRYGMIQVSISNFQILTDEKIMSNLRQGVYNYQKNFLDEGSVLLSIPSDSQGTRYTHEYDNRRR